MVFNPYLQSPGGYPSLGQQPMAGGSYAGGGGGGGSPFEAMVELQLGQGKNANEAERIAREFEIAWNQGEVNKQLGIGKLINERMLGMDDNNAKRDVARMGMQGGMYESDANRAWREYGEAQATQRAEIGIRPEMLGLNYKQDRFNQMLPSMQDFMGSYSDLLRGGIGGGVGWGGDVGAAGEWGMAQNAAVVPTPGAGGGNFQQMAQAQLAQQQAPAQQGGYVDPYANAQPGAVGDPASGRWKDTGPGMQEWEWTDGKIHTQQAIGRRKPPPGYQEPAAQQPALRAPFQPPARNTGAAPAAAAPAGDPRLAQLRAIQDQQNAYIGQQGASGNPAAMQGRGGIDPATMARLQAQQKQQGGGESWDGQVGQLLNKQAYSVPNAPTAPAPANATMSASSAARNMATAPATTQGMVPRTQTGMPINMQSPGALGATAWNSKTGPDGGPILLDDLGTRAFNAAPQIDTSPVYGGAEQNALLGQQAAYNANEAKNATKMATDMRGQSGMAISDPRYRANMGRLFNNQGAINTNNQKTNMISQFAQSNANQRLAAQQARNTQYQQGLNYGLSRRGQSLQNRAQNQNFALGSFNAKVGAAAPMFSMMSQYS